MACGGVRQLGSVPQSAPWPHASRLMQLDGPPKVRRLHVLQTQPLLLASPAFANSLRAARRGAMCLCVLAGGGLLGPGPVNQYSEIFAFDARRGAGYRIPPRRAEARAVITGYRRVSES